MLVQQKEFTAEADSNLGYYDPNLHVDGKDCAIWYEDMMLHIHILFETSKFVF